MGERIPVTNPELGPFLARMKLQARLRRALENRGYQEVTTFALQPDSGGDPQIEPFAADYLPGMEPEPPARRFFLHTSPEFAMKRLLCRGLGAIYQICPAFRQGEHGAIHSPEFTMAEWYRAGFAYEELMAETEAVVAEAIEDPLRDPGPKLSLPRPWPRISVAEAFSRAGVDSASWQGLSEREYRLAFDRAWVERLEPWLKDQAAAFLTDFPRPYALLSRLRDDGPEVAERFELVMAGIEIANGCAELTDPAEHRRRFAADREIRAQFGRPALPAPEAFLADLETLGLPPCAGVALGVDRLAMVAAGARRLAEVQAFPFGK
jgi:lysyl-tRNA synthetase class 2